MKRFFCLFVVCFLVFSCSAFALTVTEFPSNFPSIPQNIIDNEYPYFCYYTDFSNRYVIYYVTNGDFLVTQSGCLYHTSNATLYCLWVDVGSTSWTSPVTVQQHDGFTTEFDDNDDFYYSRYDILNYDNSVFFSVPIPPITLQQTTQNSLGNLMTIFGDNLIVLLPIGVIILSLILAIYLIPRLVRSFL